MYKERVRFGREALGILRGACPGHPSDAVHVGTRADVPEIPGNPVILGIARSRIGLQGTDDLGDMLVGVLAMQGVHILRQAMVMAGIAEEELGVVEQLGALQKALVSGDSMESGHHFIHAAVLTRNVAVPHADECCRRNLFKPGVHPEAHSLGDFQCLLVSADFIAIEQSGQDFVQGVVGCPDLVFPAAVGGSLFKQDKLIRRVGADEPLAPIPVVGPDPLHAQVGAVIGLARPGRNGCRVRVEWSAFLHGLARPLRQVMQRFDQVIHLREEGGPQLGIVRRAGIGLGNRREVMPAGMATQLGRLAVPNAQWLDPFRLRLAEGIAKHVEKAVRVGLRQGLDKLFAILDGRRLPLLIVEIQDDLSQGKRLQQALGSRLGGRRLANRHGRLRLEVGAGHLAGHGVGPRLEDLLVALGEWPDDANLRTGTAIAVDTLDHVRQGRQMPDARFGRDVGNSRQTQGFGERRDLGK